jgi:hypothetical protein
MVFTEELQSRIRCHQRQLDDGQATLIDNVSSLGDTLRFVFSLIRKNK